MHSFHPAVVNIVRKPSAFSTAVNRSNVRTMHMAYKKRTGKDLYYTTSMKNYRVMPLICDNSLQG